MTIEGNDMSEYRKEKRQVEVSIGESVRIIRELQGMSQNELAAAAGIPQSTISAIERDRINLGVERAKQLAKALRCHPAVLVFPGWDVEHESAT
jgi:transcriptional regulator with XRE-family HTH domain